jgi:hypothetical protein
MDHEDASICQHKYHIMIPHHAQLLLCVLENPVISAEEVCLVQLSVLASVEQHHQGRRRPSPIVEL